MICSLVLVLSRSLSLPHTYINYKINNILFCILSVSALVERYCFCCVEYYFAWYLWIRDLHCGHQWASYYKIWKKKKKAFFPFIQKLECSVESVVTLVWWRRAEWRCLQNVSSKPKIHVLNPEQLRLHHAQWKHLLRVTRLSLLTADCFILHSSTDSAHNLDVFQPTPVTDNYQLLADGWWR